MPILISRIFEKFLILIFSAGLFLACSASVPQETITLSETLGRDLVQIQVSYQALIKSHYAQMRQEAEKFINEKYIPFILQKVIEKKQVLDKLNQKVEAGDYTDALEYLSAFSRSAQKQINEFRNELLKPINEQEITLLAEVETAFQNMHNANIAITAHLASVRKVQQEQGKISQSLQLKKFSDQVMVSTIGLSNQLSSVLDEVNMTGEPNEVKSSAVKAVENLISNTNQQEE